MVTFWTYADESGTTLTDVLWDISDLPFVKNEIEKKTLAPS